MLENNKKHVYIIGSKGIPAKYGGFETFVEKLTEYQVDDSVQYHVACMLDNSLKSNITDKHFIHNNADCFNIDVPNMGPARAIYYDIKALDYAIKLATKNQDKNPIFYVLACRIGPFIKDFKKRIKKLNGKLFVNPDGHEWLREKWSQPVREYWRFSEKLMVKYSDLMICDSQTIEKYIQTDYKKHSPKTTYIAYGTDTNTSKYNSQNRIVRNWFDEKQINENDYFLVVGRFVPENNYETIIKEFMKSDTSKDLILVTNVEKNKFYHKLLKATKFDRDNRIKFVGTVYDQDLLKYIRENAFAYIHGHEVGGTNPSLLEAMYSTNINLLLDVEFNREVGKNGAIYWKKNSLENEIKKLEKNVIDFKYEIGKISTEIVLNNFEWEKIEKKYKKIFESERVIV